MKRILPLTAALTLAHFAGAAETLIIGPAHGFSDYTKLTAATGNSNRLFIVGFAVGDFNKDGRTDLVVETGFRRRRTALSVRRLSSAKPTERLQKAPSACCLIPASRGTLCPEISTRTAIWIS